jgi:hypothetical protein
MEEAMEDNSADSKPRLQTDLSGRAIHRGHGHHVKHPSGADMYIKVFASETGGAYSLMETVLPPGGVIPLHVHADEDENNYVLDVGRFRWITVIADRITKSETMANANLSVVRTEVDEEDEHACRQRTRSDHSVASESLSEFGCIGLGACRTSSDASHGIF